MKYTNTKSMPAKLVNFVSELTSLNPFHLKMSRNSMDRQLFPFVLSKRVSTMTALTIQADGESIFEIGQTAES